MDGRSPRRVINGKREKKLSLNCDLFFHQHRFDWELSNFHFQHACRMATSHIRFFRESNSAERGSPGRPSLDLNDDFATFLVQQLLRHRNRLIRG